MLSSYVRFKNTYLYKNTSKSFGSTVHGEARNIKFGQEVNLIQRDLFGTLSLEVLTSLPHIGMTLKSIFISCQRSYCYQIWAVKTTWQKSIGHVSIRGSNVITFWLSDIDESLYLSWNLVLIKLQTFRSVARLTFNTHT